MIKEIVKDENFLTKKSEIVEITEAQEIITDLLDTAKHHIDNCVGLAAPQIGVLKKVIVIKNGDNFVPMINPIIIKRVGTKFLNKEGCLSLDGERTVYRYPSVMVSFTDRNGKKQVKTFNGFTSIIIQHETDHLSGKLI